MHTQQTVQLVSDVEPGGEICGIWPRGGHEVSIDEPSVQNDPEEHCVHASLEVARVAAENVPAEHGAHVSLEVARVAAENVPAGHAYRVAGVAQYEPAPQSTSSAVERAAQ